MKESMGYGRLLITALAFTALSAFAGISVDRSIMEFEPDGEYFTDISVYNSEKTKAYVAVSVFEVVNPGQKNEAKQPLTDPDKALLIATPSRMVLEPGQASPVRVLNLDEDQNDERIYRILVEPVSGRLKGDVDGVKVLVSYEMLVIVRPQNPVIKVLAQRSGTNITFYNNGNTSVYLESGRQCSPNKADDCKELSGTRLYKGASWSTETTWETNIVFTMNTGGEKTITQTFDGKDTLPKAP